MRIAIFHNLPTGGAKRVLDEQVRFLSQNHQVKVFTFDLPETKKGTPANRRLVKDFNNFVCLYFYHKGLAKKIDKQKFDVVLVHPDKLTQAPYLLRHLATPSVYFCEELLRIVYEKQLAFTADVGILKRTYELLTRNLRKYVDLTSAKSATKIVVASKFIKNKVKFAYNIDAFVCSLGVDTKTFKPTANKSKHMINQLVFIGEKNNINGYNFAKQISLKTKLSLKVISGWKLTDAQMANLYANSLATLCVSYGEPFGLVPLEVQACGGIVLAVNEGGYTETIINNETGFLLPRKIPVFVDKISWLTKNNSRLQKIRLAARQHIIKNYTWKIHGKCLEKQLKLQ
ncbi:MAG: glycosyltransferase family 4 protein [Patescibacteria group bacterium]